MPTVAIIGASTDRSKYGNKALRAFRQQGFTVVPIHPRETDVEGVRAYARVTDYPGRIDEATFYVPPAIGLQVIDEVAAKQVPVIWLNPGADAPALVERARALGVETRVACSILGIGESPSRF